MWRGLFGRLRYKRACEDINSMKNYYVSEWALRRQAEIMDMPEEFEIHADYLKVLPRGNIIAAFATIRGMIHDVFQDIADEPERFKMPLVEIRADNLTKYGFPPPEAQTSKRAPYMFLDALNNLLICGTVINGELSIERDKLAEANRQYKTGAYKAYAPKSYAIKNVDRLYSQLDRYGLYLEGLKNFKLPGGTERITLRYPDNPDVLTVLKWMADKAHDHDRRQEFMICNYRLLQDKMDSFNYEGGADYIADKTHTRQEKDFAYRFDSALREKGLLSDVDNRAEMPGEDSYAVYYYVREKDFGNRSRASYKLTAKQTKLQLGLRIKCIQNCTGYIETCSDEIKSLFIPGDKGCPNRPHCTHGQGYTISGTEYWHCGCCGNLLTFTPRAEDIGAYIKLVEMGN